MYRIMIAEENRKEYQRMKEIIIRMTEEIEVLPCAFDAASFISTLSEQKPDLVIADIQLPGLEDFRTVEYIRYIKSQAQILLISECTEFEEVRRAFREQIADYLLRPVREGELMDSVQRLVQEWKDRDADRRSHGGKNFSYHKYMRVAEKEFMMSLLLGTPDFAVLDELSDQGEMVYYMMTVIAGDGISFAGDQSEQMVRQVFPDEICLKLYYNSVLYLLICKSDQSSLTVKDAKERMWANSKAEEMVSFFGVERESVQIGISDGMKSPAELKSGLENALRAAGEDGKSGRRQEGERATQSPACEKDYAARALEYMSKNYGRKLSLSEVADSIGVTGFYLSHLISKVEHKTFSELLTDIRVKKAVELLREGQRSVREIGILCGYPNVKYFYRILKKHTGMTAKQIQNTGRRIRETDSE